MLIDVSTLSRGRAAGPVREVSPLFDVACVALLRLSSPANEAGPCVRTVALAIIDRYPDHPLFSAVTSGAR